MKTKEEKAKEIAKFVIESPKFVKQLGMEIAERIRKGIHTDTDIFWEALEQVQKAGVNTELALLYIEDAILDRKAELEELKKKSDNIKLATLEIDEALKRLAKLKFEKKRMKMKK